MKRFKAPSHMFAQLQGEGRKSNGGNQFSSGRLREQTVHCATAPIILIWITPFQEYANFKKELVDVERHLLREFGFILHVDHPHKFVLNYLNLLKAGPELKQEAWNLCNDRSSPFQGESSGFRLSMPASKGRLKSEKSHLSDGRLRSAVFELHCPPSRHRCT